MTHIDEGTIHAWLDGALPPDEVARVEAHVRDCAACSAAVAEARGLIAASSRIILALDDVPGGVIPQRVDDPLRAVASAPGPREAVPPAGAANGGGAVPVLSRARRAWWQRPQFAAAASIVFIAVAVSVVARRGGVKSVADYSMESAPAIEAPAVASPPQPPVVAPPPGQAPAAATAAPADQKDAVTPATPASREAVADVATRQRSVVENRVLAAPAAKRSAVAASAAKESTVADTAARGVAVAPQAAPAGGIARAADRASPRQKLAVNPDAITRAEKQRVLGERALQLEAVVTTSAAEARIDARRDYTTVQRIVGCYRLQRRVPALDAGITEVVALDATEAGTHEGDVLRVARLIGAAPERNALWRWTLSPRGDVALVRVQGEAYARFPLALRLAAQTGETSIATRVDCPAR